MSLRAIPLTIIPFIIYNLIVLFSGSPAPEVATDGAAAARALLASELFSIPMISGARWFFTWGDLILIITLIVLFIEILKATYTSTSSLVDHGLSMVVFVAALIEFIVVPQAATSVFFLLLVALVIDVIAGFTIGIRVAKRDIGFGTND
ncbi:MAG: hypothetical protein JNN24_07830 [Hyphomicrobium zavarzinii]|jgi:hypothetical protein|uniref:hypothetical protein n=1 Tax=Hyphomicrobium TaxID=81 RepID=UPI00036125FF|nr:MULTISPECIES: hypothetical protein [Hyphomicrobium]MBL8845664.1 hypothetical protein [Hyphomicrobium zavarzinii]WBT38853.1 hypothetical protein PE058_02950 [Hyphomicrobium sp. DMF-1]HML42873.1 hypothetical protein [Hyphomicrobium zavarzinii]